MLSTHCTYRPFLRFIEPVEDPDKPGNGGGEDLEPTVDHDGEKKKVSELSVEEQRDYWKKQSRKNESKAKKAPADYEQIKRERDELKAKNQTEEEKALEAARAEGARAAQGTFLTDAVAGHLRALTGLDTEDLEEALDVVDLNKFVKDGRLDTEKLERFAGTLRNGEPEKPAPHTQPDAIRRNAARQAAAGGNVGKNAGSIADIRKRRREELLPTPRS